MGNQTRPQPCQARTLSRRRFIPQAVAAAWAAGSALHPRRLLADLADQAASSGSPAGMSYRVLGKTGIRVSAVSFGSHVNNANLSDQQGRTAQISKGLDLGINLFDIYDHTYHQFAVMSQALGPVRQQVVLSLVTVWDRARVLQEVEYALTTFKTDVIDLYRIYMDAGTARSDVEARYLALRQAQQEGKIRAVGLVTHDHAVLADMLRTYPELDYVMLPYNFQYQRFSPSTVVRPTSWGRLKQAGGLPATPARSPGPGGPARRPLDPEADCMTSPCPDPELLALVRQTGVGVIAIKPFAAGGLLQLPPSDPLLESLQGAQASLPQAALRFILDNQDIASAMPAMNSLAEVAEDAGAPQAGGMSAADAALLQLCADATAPYGGPRLPAQYAWLRGWST